MLFIFNYGKTKDYANNCLSLKEKVRVCKLHYNFRLLILYKKKKKILPAWPIGGSKFRGPLISTTKGIT